MKSSIKASILNDLRFLKVMGYAPLEASRNGNDINKGQRYQSLSRIDTLVSVCVSVLVSFSATVAIAATPQQIAQVNSPEIINRPTLQVGSKGERVTELQAALQLLGFYTGKVDGVYNEDTVQAVSRFQQAAGLKADGVVDVTTWQRLFPNEPMVASSGSSSNSTSRFPVPSQAANNQVVVPTSSRPTTTGATVPNSKPEPRATTTSTTVVNSKPEPKPARPTATTTTAATTSKPEPKPARPTATTTTATTTSKPEPKPARPTATATQRTTVRQSTSARAGATRSEQTTRIQQSDGRSSSTTRSRQISSIQYTPQGLPILRPGMRGSEVVKLQQRLQRLGFLKTGNIDGDFGTTTEAAVIALQKRYGLEADGVVGGATWEILTRRRGG
jgi:peptidoglycan hydrolase-like protein with peptidoglycan-binding domain